MFMLETGSAGANELTAALEALGADVLAIPVIAVRPPPDTGALDVAARNVAGYDWLVFTSVNGVRFFFEALARVHVDSQTLIREGAPLEIVAAPQLSIGVFRLSRRSGESLADWNSRNSALIDAVNRRERVYLSSTLLPVADGGAFTLRTCILSFRTHEPQVHALLDDLREALKEVA